MSAIHDYSQHLETKFSHGQTKGDKTREAISQTAFQILHTDGYQALTIAALSEGAGIRRNSYYTHFKDLSEVIDTISTSLLDKIGCKSVLDADASVYAPSIALRRVRYVLSLGTTEPEVARALSELHAHHPETAEQIHRRLKLDILADRRRGLHRATTRECAMAAMLIASGAMSCLRPPSVYRTSDKDLFLTLVMKICGYTLKSISQ